VTLSRFYAEAFIRLQRGKEPGRQVVRNEYYINQFDVPVPYLRRTRDALGNVSSFLLNRDTYEVDSMFDINFQRTDFGYNERGQVIYERDAMGNETQRRYNAKGSLLDETRSRTVNGAAETLTTRYRYDAKDRLLETTHPDGTKTSSTYNAIDKVETETDTAGRVTRFEYTERCELSKTIYPDQSYSETTYDAEGRELTTRDRLGRITEMKYDPLGRLVETIYPDATPNDASDNPRTVSEYDAAGQLRASVDALGNRTEYRYDDAGRQIEIKDALGNVSTSEYDLTGRRLSSTDALNRTTKYQYDLAGKLIATVYPDADADDGNDANNPKTQVVYDRGRKAAEIDEMNRITRFGFDSLGRLDAVVLANPTTGANPAPVSGVFDATAGTLITRYGYDELGQKTRQIDALGRITQWSYDKSGRQLSRTLPMGQVERMDYNPAGELIKKTDFNGQEISYEYNAEGELQTMRLPNNHIRSFSYDDNGQVIEINDGGQVYQFQYDERNRLIKATDAKNRTIDYRYDANNNKREATSAKQTVTFNYDELNRLKEVVASIDNQANQRTEYRYTEVGSRAGVTLPNGSVTNYQYDRRNRLKSITHKASAAANAALLLGLSYTVDASGLRTELTSTRPHPTTANTTVTLTNQWGYDKLKRLTTESMSGTGLTTRTRSWIYDAVGNRMQQSTSAGTTTYVYDANDRLSSETTAGVTKIHNYDPNGNLLSTKQGSTTLAEYRWDAENRMIGSTLANKITSYTYDPNGIRRAQEEVTGTNRKRTDYLVDTHQPYAQVIEEWSATGTTGSNLTTAALSASYIHGDDLISQTKAAISSFYHYDGLGSVRGLSNDAAAMTDRYAYTAFGEIDSNAGANWNSGSTENNYLYTGEQLDPNLGFYYLRARYMDPSRGRFLGMDSYMGSDQDPMSLHKYAYVHGMPTGATDPSGMVSLSQLGAAFRVAATLAVRSLPNIGRVLVKRAASASVRLGAGLRRLVNRCIKKPERCDLDTSTYIESGNEQTARHVFDAQIGRGSNLIPAGFWFHHADELKPRDWYKNEARCHLSSVTKFCDEFPYANTLEGGPKNHPGRVSLRLVPADEQRSQGGRISAFLKACGIKKSKRSGRGKKSSEFYVLGAPDFPAFPYFICADSK
jgi:RHS repeat-associated protein